MTDQETIKTYNQNVDAYVSMVNKAKPDKAMRQFLKALPSNAYVLDLGCGPGTSSRFIKDAGHSVDAVDASSGMVETVMKLHGIKARVATFDDIKEIDEYDAVWANFSLLHASRTDFKRHLMSIHDALKPSGVFHIGMKLGEGERRDRLNRFYTYYGRQELLDLLAGSGFKSISTEEGEEEGLAGDLDRWMVVLAVSI